MWFLTTFHCNTLIHSLWSAFVLALTKKLRDGMSILRKVNPQKCLRNSKVCLRTVTNQCWRFLDLMWFEPYLYISHITQTPGLISLWYFLVIPLKPSCRFRKCLKSFPENRKTDLTRIIGDTLLHEKLVTKKKKWRKNLGGEGAGK